MSKNKSYKRQKESDRKLKLFQKDIKRKDKFQNQNPIAQRVMQNKISIEKEILKAEKEILFSSLNEIQMLDLGLVSPLILVPTIFSFEDNYLESLLCIKSVATSMVFYMGNEIEVNFTNCEKCGSSALFVLQVINLEIIEKIKEKLHKFKIIDVVPRFMVGLPKKFEVERLLIVSGFLDKERIDNIDKVSELHAIDHVGYLKGSKPQKSHHENRKGPHTKKIVSYLDECLNRHGYKFIPVEWNEFEGIISEALSNAEDHSERNNWYISANFSQEVNQKNRDITVGEINLSIMNFGKSMYEAFEETKIENAEIYNRVKNFVVDHQKKFGMNFDQEQLFVFIMIQDQISRLKFERDSRGTGTMKFINSFLELGDFEVPSKGYKPKLSIYSGHSLIICDNTCKPLKTNGAYSLALNTKNELTLPPENKYLQKLKTKFPGTLLSVKIYLNKGHMDIKYKGE